MPEKEKYLYVVFQTKKERVWCYDTTSNRLIYLQGVTPEYIGSKALEDYLLKNKLIEESKVSEMRYRAMWQEYLDTLSKGLTRLTLEVTQRCNLRCSYCIYSGHYKNERVHQNVNMSMEIAKRAIELYAEHSAACAQPCVSFYGGEALLRFDFIQKVVKECRKVFAGKELLFRIATNGTTITGELCEWLRSNPDVMLDITFYGCQQDNYRKFKDGTGSSLKIFNGIKMLQEEYEDVYVRQVNFLCNYADASELEQSWKYYTSELKTVPVLISEIDRSGGDEYIQGLGGVSAETEKRISDAMQKRYLEMQDAFAEVLFDPAMTMVHKRSSKRLDNIVEIENCCFPFLTNLYVKADGVISICEKVTSNAEFGDVIRGYDLYKTKALMDNYLQLRSKYCRECWAQRFCTLCFKDIGILGAVVHEDILQKCREMRQIVKDNLVLYCTVIEEAPEHLKRYQEMQVSDNM